MDSATLQYLRRASDESAKPFETGVQAALNDTALINDVGLKVWNSLMGDWLKDHRCVVVKMKKKEDHFRDHTFDLASVARIISRFAVVQADPKNPAAEIHSIPPSAVELLRHLVNQSSNVIWLDSDFYRKKHNFFNGRGRMDDRLRRYLTAVTADFKLQVDEWARGPELAQLPAMERQWMLTLIKEGIMQTPWYGGDVDWDSIKDGARWNI